MQGAVAVGGNLIFNGDILMKGLGWPDVGRSGGELQNVVGALAPQVGVGSEFSDRPWAGLCDVPLKSTLEQTNNRPTNRLTDQSNRPQSTAANRPRAPALLNSRT